MAFQSKAFLRVYELRNKISIFLKEENHAFVTTFEDKVFLNQLAYLYNIFSKLNQLNISLQGKETYLLQLHDKITAFKRKLQLWKTDLLINNEQCDSFPLLKFYLNSQSGYYIFFEDMEKRNWIRNPFVDNTNASQGFTSVEAEQFMDLSSDLILKSIYNPNSLISFWVMARSKLYL